LFIQSDDLLPPPRQSSADGSVVPDIGCGCDCNQHHHSIRRTNVRRPVDSIGPQNHLCVLRGHQAAHQVDYRRSLAYTQNQHLPAFSDRGERSPTSCSSSLRDHTAVGVPCGTLGDNSQRHETVTVCAHAQIGVDPAALESEPTLLLAGPWTNSDISDRRHCKGGEHMAAIVAGPLAMAPGPC
jgi:hypothetical protein